MAFFTEEMELMTNELLASRQERGAFVSNVRDQSQKLLTQTQAHLQSVRQGVQQMLSQTRARRQQDVAKIQQDVARIRTDCRAAQRDLASDLRQAAQTWQRMFQVRTTPDARHQGKTKKGQSPKKADDPQ